MMHECHVCGNEIVAGGITCPFCGSKTNHTDSKTSRKFIHKIVNLESGRPAVEVALSRMSEAIEDAARAGVTVLTLIHGYGSSGKGGVIRAECRNNLDYLKYKGVIKDVIAGEDFSKRSGAGKAILRRFPQLALDRNLNIGNRGITLVVI